MDCSSPVGQDLVEHRQLDVLGRGPQPALVQERRQADRLQRDGLAAGVRAGDDDGAKCAGLEVDRHGRRGIEERVPRLAQRDAAAARHLRPPPAPREAGAGEGEIDRADRLHEADDPVRLVADSTRELAQDPRDLLALGALGLAQAVGVLDDGERLDEQRLPGARGVVDDARHRAAGRGAERENGPAGALGDEVLRQVLAERRVACERPQPLGDPPTALPELSSQAPKRRRGAVPQIRAVVLHRARDRLRDAH